jgi:hypothetical protein
MCDILAEDCSICLEYINSDDLKQKTVCQHTFHASCLSRWTQANNSCPLCRTRFAEGAAPPAPQASPPTASGIADISFAALSDLIIEEDENQPLMNNYNFALEPERPQPSGTQNRSRIGDVRLNYLTVPFNMFPESYIPSGSVNGARVFT